MKRLMQRYSLASQLDTHSVFGILVSNTGTAFAKSAIAYCQNILKKHNKKSFLFTMSRFNIIKII